MPNEFCSATQENSEERSQELAAIPAKEEEM